MLLQLPAGRPVGMVADAHMRLQRRAPALAQIAGGTGRRDILPGRASALRARQDMVEGQLVEAAAILAGEAVAQEQVEPGEGWIFARPYILAQRDHARQLEGPARAVHLALIGGDDVDPLQEQRLDRGLPGPEAERIIAERRVIRVQHESGTAFRMPEKVGMVQGQQAPVSRRLSPGNAAPDTCRTQNAGERALGRPLLVRHAVATLRDALMTP